VIWALSNTPKRSRLSDKDRDEYFPLGNQRNIAQAAEVSPIPLAQVASIESPSLRSASQSSADHGQTQSSGARMTFHPGRQALNQKPHRGITEECAISSNGLVRMSNYLLSLLLLVMGS
ncbi:hypothetical protein HAX54_003054, partial [Datura stramonium]|nr:hypothetical protein [Datura stramonium]